jgi:pimeloyl-ACP methyl ester carboxylesterase
VAGLIQGLNLDRPAILGHSMGASTAATLAASYPNLASKVLLEDPPWRDEEQGSVAERQAGREAWRQQIAAYKGQTRDEIIAYGRQRSPLWDELEFGPWSEAKMLVSPQVVDFVSARRPWREVAAEITVPTLLTTADPDLGAIVTPEIAQSIADSNAHITIAHIPQAGHNIRREQFEAFVKTVRNFLS